MADAYQNSTQTQNNLAEFGPDLAVTVRELHRLARSAPGNTFRKRLSEMAEQAQRMHSAHGVNQSVRAKANKLADDNAWLDS